jgi:hypothetical protein
MSVLGRTAFGRPQEKWGYKPAGVEDLEPRSR